MICTAVGTNARQHLRYDKRMLPWKKKVWKTFLMLRTPQLILSNRKTPSHLVAFIGVTNDRTDHKAKMSKIFKTSFVDIRIRKGPQPLEEKTFYLDIKNHAVAAKLEAQIRELGGVSCISSPACTMLC